MKKILSNKKEVCFISSGLIEPKKNYNGLSEHNFYLNYGLLGMASELPDSTFSSKVYHGEYIPPDVFFEKFQILNKIDLDIPLFLSIPSFFAVPWACEFVALVKQAEPLARIVVGGRWVTNGNSKWIREKLGDVDLVVEGVADGLVEDLLHPKRWESIPGCDLSNIPSNKRQCPSYLNYQRLERWEEIHPSIEISSGCGAGCEFCPEGSTPISSIKTPNAVFDEIDQYISLSKDLSPKFYFETSNFMPSKEWVDQFSQLYKENGYQFSWRTEVRADTFAAVDIESLAQAGLKVIDIGLESCSEEQLIRMGKTNTPYEYLKKADILLRKCFDAGVWAKTNILLYPGETNRTIEETIEWLVNRKTLIKGASVGPLIVFGCNDDTRNYIASFSTFNTRPVCDDSYLKTGITYLHLSNEINYEKSIAISIEISKLLMTSEDYFDIKSHGYFKKSFKHSEFENIVSKSNIDNLPFSLFEDLSEVAI